MGQGQDAIAKPDHEVSVKPRLQLGPLPALRKDDESLADFPNRECAEKERRHGLCFEPLYDSGLWTIPTEFGRNVGVEQIAAHKSTRRPVDGFRLN